MKFKGRSKEKSSDEQKPKSRLAAVRKEQKLAEEAVEPVEAPSLVTENLTASTPTSPSQPAVNPSPVTESEAQPSIPDMAQPADNPVPSVETATPTVSPAPAVELAQPSIPETPHQPPTTVQQPAVDQFGLGLLEDEPKKKSHKLWYIIGTVILLGAVSYTAYDFLGLKSHMTAKVNTTPAVVTTPAPSPTPVAATNLDKSKLSITILNGSGKAGAASAMQTILQNDGYTVSSIGNANNYNYTQTEIHVSPDNKDYLPVLKKDLSGSYTIGTADTNYSGSGAEVIVGAQ